MILDAFAALSRSQLTKTLQHGVPEILSMYQLLQTSQWEECIGLKTWQVEALDTLRLRGNDDLYAHRDGVIDLEPETPSFTTWADVVALLDDQDRLPTLLNAALAACERRDWTSARIATSYESMTARGWCSYLWSEALDAAHAAFQSDRPFEALHILTNASRKATSTAHA